MRSVGLDLLRHSRQPLAEQCIMTKPMHRALLTKTLAADEIGKRAKGLAVLMSSVAQQPEK